MRYYKEANDAIHTPPELLEATVQAAKRKSEALWESAREPAIAASGRSLPLVRGAWAICGACAACLVVLAVAAAQLGMLTPVTAVDERLQLTYAVKSDPLAPQPAPLTEEACAAFAGTELGDLFDGFSLVDAAYAEALPYTGSKTPDALTMQFENEDNALILTVLTRPREAAFPHTQAGSITVGGTSIAFFAHDATGTYYALWQHDGHAYMAETDTLHKARFVRTVKAAVKQMTNATDGAS